MSDSRLSEADQARVDRYLGAPSRQQVERSFHPGRLLLVIWVVLMVLSGASYWIARSHGVI